MAKGSKGGNEERITCKELSLWWSGDPDDSLFWRTQGSGGRATMRRKNNIIKREDFGDIKSDHESTAHFADFFCIESKTGYARKSKTKSKATGETTNNVTLWSLIDILDSSLKEPMFLEFWKQNERDSEFATKEPMVIFRRNRRKKCIALYSDIFKALEDEYGAFRNTRIYIEHEALKHPIIVVNFEDFMNSYPMGKDIFTKCFITRVLLPIFESRLKKTKKPKRRKLKCQK